MNTILVQANNPSSSNDSTQENNNNNNNNGSTSESSNAQNNRENIRISNILISQKISMNVNLLNDDCWSQKIVIKYVKQVPFTNEVI